MKLARCRDWSAGNCNASQQKPTYTTFDENGYMKTGKISNVEEENDSFTYYFETKNGKNGQGVTAKI